MYQRKKGRMENTHERKGRSCWSAWLQICFARGYFAPVPFFFLFLGARKILPSRRRRIYTRLKKKSILQQAKEETTNTGAHEAINRFPSKSPRRSVMFLLGKPKDPTVVEYALNFHVMPPIGTGGIEINV
jgi:hypothetical protein